MAVSTLIFVVTFVFLIAALFHTFLNSYYDEKNAKHVGLLRFFYLSLILFGCCAVWTCWSVRTAIWHDLLYVAGAVGAVHAVRFWFDWLDLRNRPGLLNLVRPVFDAGANYVTIAFVLAVAARHDRTLFWPAILLSAMLICKEMYFRMVIDNRQRRTGAVTSSQGGIGEPTDPDLSAHHAFYGRWLKSLFYIIVGFALVFLSLGVVDPKMAQAITSASGSVGILPALQFSIKNMGTGGMAQSAPDYAVVLALLEFGANAFLAYHLRSLPLVTRR